MKHRTSLDLDTVCAIALDLICGIQYLEQQRVVHNNIKASNVLIRKCLRVSYYSLHVMQQRPLDGI